MTSDGDPITTLLDRAGLHDEPLSADDLGQLWDSLGFADDALGDEFIDVIAALALADDPAQATVDPELHLRLGQWRVDIARQGIRAGVMTAVVAAVMVQRGLTEFGVAFATAVLPSIIDVERVELAPGDRRLLLEIRLRPAFREGFATEDELYNSLPAETRAVVNPYDFADFIGRIRDAGLLEEGSEERVRLRDPDDRRPGLIVR